MDCCEIAIIGSGPAGVAAAMSLAGRGVTLIDVGHTPAAGGATAPHLGPAFEGVRHLGAAFAVHPKMRGAGFAHVDTGEPYRVLDPDGREVLRSCLSHARGGFAEAWGGQLLRYTPDDIVSLGDWPRHIADRLQSHYDALERHIGIAGARDDLDAYLGDSPSLLPPLPLTPLAETLLARARRRPAAGVTLGQPRLAVLPGPHQDRPAYRFANDEFRHANDPGLYRPRLDLERLIARRAVDYRPGLRLVRYAEHPEHVVLDLVDRTGAAQTLRARHVLIACGAVQSAAVVLRSEPGFAQAHVPFLDHPPTLLPVFFPFARRDGTAAAYPIQLIASIAGGSSFASLYSLHGLAPGDRLLDLPVPMPAARRLLPHLLPRMMVAQVWDRATAGAAGRLQLGADRIEIAMPSARPSPAIPALVRALRALGGVTAARLATTPLPTWGYHHVGTLPMTDAPAPLQTHTDGRLWHRRRVRVIDGALLPSLPAKNPSLTIMANASRIAACLARELDAGGDLLGRAA